MKTRRIAIPFTTELYRKVLRYAKIEGLPFSTAAAELLQRVIIQEEHTDEIHPSPDLRNT